MRSGESECESEESLLYEKAKVAAFERAMQDMVIDRNLRGNISKYPIAKRYDDRGNHEDINGSDQNVNHLRKNPSLSSRLKKETGPLEMNPKQLRCKVCTLLPPCNHISVKSESSSLEKLQNECAYACAHGKAPWSLLDQTWLALALYRDSKDPLNDAKPLAPENCKHTAAALAQGSCPNHAQWPTSCKHYNLSSDSLVASAH